MDAPVPFGPRRVAAKNQVSIPGELLAHIGCDTGDAVWFAVNPDRPGTLIIVPRRLMMEILQKGWTAGS